MRKYIELYIYRFFAHVIQDYYTYFTRQLITDRAKRNLSSHVVSLPRGSGMYR